VSDLRELSLGWVEEPIWPPDDAAGLAALRSGGVPISAGENASGVQGFRTLFEANALDIAQPSVAKIGGISGMLDVIELAQSFDVTVVPHCFYYGAGLLATANVVATLPRSVSLEIPWLQWPEPLHAAQNTGAMLQLDTRPGLNFRPDDQIMARYLIDKASLRAQ
jgi:L-alanine-DL-glutamate epimerase-like enolase superfamily enzyme